MELILCRVVASYCLPTHNIAPHISWHASPNRISIRLSQIDFPIIVLLKDDHTDFVQEERLGLSILDHDFGHLCRGRRIQMSGHSDFGIINNL